MVAVIIALASSMAVASPSFLGATGNIFTPDDSVLRAGDFTANFHDLVLSDNVNVLAANAGLTDDLEIGVARFDSNAAGAGTETIISAKYRLLPESVRMPSIAIGAVDATGQIDTKGNPGIYVVLGKSLTKVATDLTGEPTRPVRGYIGGGSGIYSGVFVAADWNFTPKATLIAEFLSKLRVKGAIDKSSVFNLGLRFDVTDSLKADIALINTSDVGFGISYSKIVQ